MRILLDTHTFLCFVDDNPKLSAAAKKLIEDPGNDRCMSVASFWEIAIKVSLTKLDVGEPFSTFLPYQMSFNSIKVLPIQLENLLAVSTLPMHHHDPFDRMIVAVAVVEGIDLVSADSALDAYPIRRFW